MLSVSITAVKPKRIGGSALTAKPGVIQNIKKRQINRTAVPQVSTSQGYCLAMPDKIIINPFPGKSEVFFSLKIFPFDDLLPILVTHR
jgi:hypothetical protein